MNQQTGTSNSMKERNENKWKDLWSLKSECLEHASSLIVTCFEYDLGMIESLIQVAQLVLACNAYRSNWQAYLIELDSSMFENDFNFRLLSSLIKL